MKIIKILGLVCLIALIGFAGKVKAQNAEILAKQADESYRNAKYTTAIEQYESALATGKGSATLYYNLGNAYYRNEQFAHAILNYERALRLRPSMHDAKENLALAESRTTDRITELPQLFIVRCWTVLTDHVTPSTWRLILIFLTFVLAVAMVLFHLGRSLSLRKGALISIVIVVIIWIAVLAIAITSTRHFNAHSEAIVMDDAVTVKGSPEWQSIDKLLLHSGTKVFIVEELSGWYKIRIADGTTGWCEIQSIERI